MKDEEMQKNKLIELAKVLVSTLQEEISYQKKLLSLGMAKREGLVKVDIKKVEDSTLNEEGLLLSLGNVAEKRIRLITEIADMLALNQDNVSVNNIAAYVGEPYKSQLLSISSELKSVIKEVSRVNKQNKLLSEQSLFHIKEFFRILSGEEESDMAYTRRGVEKKSAPLHRVIIDQVA